MLIVVEDRDVHAITELGFDFKAFGRFDIFQIHAAKRRFECSRYVDEMIDFICIQFDIEDIDPSKLLEENGFTFHHRFRCQRADIT